MTLKRKMTSKMKTTSKEMTTSKKKMCPHLREYYLNLFLMTSHLNSHGTTDIKTEMLSGDQTGNGTPHYKCNIRGNANLRTSRKDDIFMQRRLYINEAHTALDIFRFAVFFLAFSLWMFWTVESCPGIKTRIKISHQ